MKKLRNVRTHALGCDEVLFLCMFRSVSDASLATLSSAPGAGFLKLRYATIGEINRAKTQGIIATLQRGIYGTIDKTQMLNPSLTGVLI